MVHYHRTTGQPNKKLWSDVEPQEQPSWDVHGFNLFPSEQEKRQREFRKKIHRLLYTCGEEEITEWVIRHCSFFQRLAWGLYLEWSLLEGTEDEDEIPTNGDIEAWFGKQYADSLRQGQTQLKKRLALEFPEDLYPA